MMRRALARMEAAFRTNDAQFDAIVVMTGLTFIALILGRTDKGSVWLWLGALMFWPTLAFIFNLFYPIPQDTHEKD